MSEYQRIEAAKELSFDDACKKCCFYVGGERHCSASLSKYDCLPMDDDDALVNCYFVKVGLFERIKSFFNRMLKGIFE